MKFGKGGPSDWVDLGHVTEVDGRTYVTLYRRGHVELWSLGDMGSGGTATMELLSRMPRATPNTRDGSAPPG